MAPGTKRRYVCRVPGFSRVPPSSPCRGRTVSGHALHCHIIIAASVLCIELPRRGAPVGDDTWNSHSPSPDQSLLGTNQARSRGANDWRSHVAGGALPLGAGPPDFLGNCPCGGLGETRPISSIPPGSATLPERATPPGCLPLRRARRDPPYLGMSPEQGHGVRLPFAPPTEGHGPATWPSTAGYCRRRAGSPDQPPRCEARRPSPCLTGRRDHPRCVTAYDRNQELQEKRLK